MSTRSAARGVQQPARFAHRRARRLFEQHVLAGRKRSGGELAMRAGGPGDDDGVDVAAREHVGRRCREFDISVQGADMLTAFVRWVRLGDDTGTRRLAKHAHVIGAPVPETDDTNTDCLHLQLLILRQAQG